jgi:hypothetical protein
LQLARISSHVRLSLDTDLIVLHISLSITLQAFLSKHLLNTLVGHWSA